jgi:hypothetical protein
MPLWLIAVWMWFVVSLTAADYSIENPHPDNTRSADGRWTVHDMDRPWPEKATPNPQDALDDLAKAPTDSVILFDGEDLSAWHVPDFWRINEGVLSIHPSESNLASKENFGSIRLHLEWKTPADGKKKGQNRGNSGVFLMGQYEVQILDTYENRTYADGMAAALYGLKPPDVNPLRPAGEWQFYDIWFQRPIFDENGALVSPARVTVMVNGVLVHDQVPYAGPTSHRKRRPYQAHPDELPLKLQYHSERVSFRNIWLQRLDDGAVFDGVSTAIQQ